jgi:hypothetical protein
MAEFDFKQGERKVVNGIERACHRSYHREGRVLYEFVRPLDEGAKWEYCIFEGLAEKEGGKLVGKVFRTDVIESYPIGSPLDSASNLYSRGWELWRIAEKAGAEI